MTDEQLKPCPFCGGDATLYGRQVGENIPYQIMCSGCPAEMTSWDKDHIVEQWNARPEPLSAWQPIETLDRTRTDWVMVNMGPGTHPCFVCCDAVRGYWTHWCEVPK